MQNQEIKKKKEFVLRVGVKLMQIANPVLPDKHELEANVTFT